MHVAFGMGRYLNRNVFDGFGMVTVGKTQYTVRGSRRLYPEPTVTAVGPLRYEVVEPLAAVRCVLEPNEVQPIAFDLTLHGHTRPWTERNTVVRGYRTTDDVTRYIQTGSAEAGSRWRHGLRADPIELLSAARPFVGHSTAHRPASR